MNENFFFLSFMGSLYGGDACEVGSEVFKHRTGNLCFVVASEDVGCAIVVRYAAPSPSITGGQKASVPTRPFGCTLRSRQLIRLLLLARACY
jgi:hypothetical protein